MALINEPSTLEACGVQQVMLCLGDLDPEELNISIVNDRVNGSKRQRDEVTAVTPDSKRSRIADFRCSTPSSTSAEHSEFLGEHAGSQNPQQDEIDDTLLKASDNEDDSEFVWTLDEIETILASDDDDEPCYAAEPSGKYNEMTKGGVTVTPSESEKEAEHGGASPSKTLNTPDALIEETQCEGDISIYAAMPPSPCQPAIDLVEVVQPKQSSLCNVKPHAFPTPEMVMDKDLPTTLSDVKEVPACQLSRSASPTLVQPSILSRVDAAVDWSEDQDFDFVIDNLLAISPGTAFSLDKDNGVESSAITTKVNSFIISDSTSPPQIIESGEVLTANATCTSTSDAAPYPLSLNTAGLPKVRHHPTQPECSTTFPKDTAKPKLNTASSGNAQNVECKKPSDAKECKVILNAESSSRSTGPTQSATPRANGNQSKIIGVLNGMAHGSSAPEKEKPRIAVVALPRTSYRNSLPDLELETKKEYYCDQVLMHIDSGGDYNSEDPLYELAALLNRTSRENPNWQHPSDYTKRNHPRFGKKPSKLSTLKQWVANNGGPDERFKNLPAFIRSPIPSFLPLNS